MALRILLLLLIGLGSTSAQIQHCVPCTEPFHDFDYNKACDELRNFTGYIDEYQQPILVSVINIQNNILERKVSLCVPCSESFVDFDKLCDDLSRISVEDKSNEICNEEKYEVFFEGKCQILLEQGTCPENHWLVINNNNNGPVCEYNKCFDSTSFYVNYKGLCLNLNRGGGYECEEGKNLAVSPDGTADCECSGDEMVKLPYREDCFSTRQKIYECAHNWLLEKSIDGNPVCVRNFCSDADIYSHGRCWPLSSHCEVKSEIIFEPKSSYFNNHENIIRCRPLPQPPEIAFSLSGGLSGSFSAEPISTCYRNAARNSFARCPIFIMPRKKKTFF